MPFKLPKHLLEWFKQKSPEAKIDQLVRTIGQVNALIQGREDALSALVRKHIFMAEEDCNAALVNSKFDNKMNNAECIRHIEFGLFRLELAKQQLYSEHLESCPPNFEENTAQYRGLELSGAIIKTKMALEFSNCVVSESSKVQLISVVKMFNDAIELLKSNKLNKSRRTTEAGLLLLYLIAREIEIDNHESIVDLNSVWKNATAESLSIKKAIEASYNLKASCCHCPSQASPKTLSRLANAIAKLHSAIDAYLAAQYEVVNELVSSSMLQVKLAAESFQNAALQEEQSPASLPKEDEVEQSEKQFKTKILLLQRLVSGRAQQAELANRRLYAAEKYYLEAASIYRKALAEENSKNHNDLASDQTANRQRQVELKGKADKMARSAGIDLEFARNLLLGGNGETYHKLIKRIAADEDQ